MTYAGGTSESDRWRVQPDSRVRLAEYDPDDTSGTESRAAAEVTGEADLERLRDLQERLYVEGTRALLLVLQGMDTSGKDGMVRHLSRGIDLLGTELTNFKAPTETDLRHDFLWRVHQHTPMRGHVGIFNRSHYEDVLIVRVHTLVPPAVWGGRYRQINDFEHLLTQHGTTVIKCFLHISNAEQRQRLQDRLDDPTKRWKFNPGDLAERERWDAYTEAYEAALSRCSTDAAPWFIIPADKKWYRNWAVTRVLVEALERLNPQPPAPTIDPASIQIR